MSTASSTSMPTIKAGRDAGKFVQSPMPNFIIIGSCKSGTTRLYDDIATHPKAFMPEIKEPSILHLAKTKDAVADAYRRHFKGMAEGQFCGEASTAYTMVPEQPDIAAFARACLPDETKLIYIMRDPIARIISHLAHDYSVNRIPDGDFDAHVLREPRYVNWSAYDMQLAPWLEAFGADKILCLSFEAFIKDRKATMEAVCAHLGIDPNLITIDNAVSNKRGTLVVGRHKAIDHLSESLLYKLFIAKVLPLNLRSVLKGLLSRKTDIPDFELSQATQNTLRERLGDPIGKLHAMGVSTFGIASTYTAQSTDKAS